MTIPVLTPITTTVEIKGVTIIKDSATTVREDFFQTQNRFSELDTEQKKIEARQNLELQNIDCGEFF